MPAASAFEVNPLVHVLRPYAGDNDTSLTVRNTTGQELRVEVRVFELVLDDRGPGRGAPADERLFVLPPAAVVPPGATQVVRMRWLDPDPLDRDASFVVAIEQVPGAMDTPTPDIGVQMLLTFNTVVHVRAQGVAPALRIEQVVTREDGGLRFTLVNDGRGNAYGERMRFTLIDGARRVPVPVEDLLAGDVHLFLSPGARQSIDLVGQPGNREASLDVDVDYDAR